MNGWDLLLLLLIAAVLFLALRRIRADRRSGKTCAGCGGSCAACRRDCSRARAPGADQKEAKP